MDENKLPLSERLNASANAMISMLKNSSDGKAWSDAEISLAMRIAGTSGLF